MTLRSLQRGLYAGLIGKQAQGPWLATLADDGPLTPAEQWAVYRGSVMGGHVKALAEIYPVCERLVGEVFFAAMATPYVRTNPSRSPDLNAYGAGFADFIAAFPPAAGVPYLADVARLEWAWHRAFHGPPPDTLDLAALAAVPAQKRADIVFQLPPCATLITSPYPIQRIWAVNQRDSTEDMHVDLDAGDVSLLVWRQADAIRIDPLAAAQCALLSAVADGRRFGDVCEQLSATDRTVDVGSVLATCLTRGWLTGFQV